ncbi:MAG: hypothetical protein GXO72_03870, partial [Caldiserica bacterium]|nr:hypothetical protein [Caldisericota bacterium]
MGNLDGKPLEEAFPPSSAAERPARWWIVRLAEVDSTQDVAGDLGEVG